MRFISIPRTTSIGHRLLSFDWVLGADIPHRCLCPADEDQKQALGDLGLGQILFRQLVFALPCRAIDDWDVVRFGVAANATAEAASHAHQAGVFERLVRSGQRSPPHAEPTRIMPRAEVGRARRVVV